MLEHFYEPQHGTITVEIIAVQTETLKRWHILKTTAWNPDKVIVIKESIG